MRRRAICRRSRDETDRRKVFVELTELADQLGCVVYDQMGAIGREKIGGMPVADMILIARFLRTSAHMNHVLAERLRFVADFSPSKGDPLAVAKEFAQTIATDIDALSDEMTAAWQADPLDGEPSGKSGEAVLKPA